MQGRESWCLMLKLEKVRHNRCHHKRKHVHVNSSCLSVLPPGIFMSFVNRWHFTVLDGFEIIPASSCGILKRNENFVCFSSFFNISHNLSAHPFALLQVFGMWYAFFLDCRLMTFNTSDTPQCVCSQFSSISYMTPILVFNCVSKGITSSSMKMDSLVFHLLLLEGLNDLKKQLILVDVWEQFVCTDALKPHLRGHRWPYSGTHISTH